MKKIIVAVSTGERVSVRGGRRRGRKGVEKMTRVMMRIIIFYYY
jgi:hypothetical protein